MPDPAGGTVTGRAGDGYIRLTFAPPVLTSVNLSLLSTNIVKGGSAQATATVTQSGKITFFSNGKRIPGCISQAISTTFTCNWKPISRGILNIYAKLVPTSGAYLTSNSTSVSVAASTRKNNR